MDRLAKMLIVLVVASVMPGAIGIALAQNESVTIAGSFDLSGAAADVGRDVLDGTQYAIKVLNARGGVLGKKVELKYQDNGTNPQKAIEQATSLVKDGAKFLASPQSSASAIVVSRIVSAKLHVPMCANSANSDDITIKEFQPYVFQIGPNSYMEAQAIARQLAEQPYRHYAVITADYAGGRSGANRFKQFITALNPQADIVVEEYPKFGATDYTATINKVLAAKPDFVWTFLFGSDLITFSKQAQAVGFFEQIQNHFMALYDGNTLRALGSDAAVGTLGFQRAPVNWLLKSSEDSRSYVTGFKQGTGSYPSDWSTLAYDCVMTWAQAAEDAKSFEPDPLMTAVAEKPFNSVRGTFHFGANDHQAEVPVFIGTVVQDKELSQPALDINDVVPGASVRATEDVWRKMRGG